MLDWLPTLENAQAAFRSAEAITDPAARFAALAAIAGHRLGFVETIRLDRALSAAAGPLPGVTDLSVALLGSATLDHLAPALRVAGARRQLRFNVRVGGYGQYRQEILGGTPADPADFVLLSLTARDALGPVAIDAGPEEANAAIAGAVASLRELWGAARSRFGATVIQQTVLETELPLFGSFDRLVPAAPARLVARLNDAIADAARAEGVLLLDVAMQAARDGIDRWFDVARWLQAKQEIAPAAAPLYADMLARLIGAARGQSRKCLVLDLDNTLWGGVVGDDGVEGIVLGEGSARGEAHLALQRYAKSLKGRGVILAICSKNDPAIAEAAFRDHPEMVLKRSDIAAFVANWTDKAENLRAIAAELNIGIDSLVFVDDNPVERARIRGELPMVAVPELPDDPAHYVRTLADAGYFEAVSFTAEDRARAAQYAANAERAALMTEAGSLEAFLGSLDMRLSYGPFAGADLPRAAQLINKTNQFNVTTRRYAQDEVAALAADPANITLQFRLADRFGDNGLVSAMIMTPADEAPDVFAIDTWVMSCRVFGRQLEHEAMTIAVETARRRNARGIRADYRPTAKNGVIRTLFPTLGFAEVDTDGEGTRYFLDVAAYEPVATHIHRMDAR